MQMFMSLSMCVVQNELCGEGKKLKGGHVAQLFRFLCEELGYDPRTTANATAANRTKLTEALDQSRMLNSTQQTTKGATDDNNLFSTSFLAGETSEF